MTEYTPWTSDTPYARGDRVTMTVRVERKWWQFWKPRSWVETRIFEAR